MKHKYKTIIDQEKCFAQMKVEFEIYMNVDNDRLKKHIAKHNIVGDRATELANELSLKHAKEKEQMETIDNKKDMYELLITTFNDNYLYPHIYCNYFDEVERKRKRKEFYLRTDVPNILLYEEEEEDEKVFRPNVYVKKFLSEATNLFGSVFYKMKDK